MGKTKAKGKTKGKAKPEGGQIFDDWLNTQKKLFDGWMDTTRDFQKKFVGEETLNKEKEVISDWAEKQSDLFKKWMEDSKNIFDSTITDKAKETATGFYDEWLNSQKDIISNWKNFAENWQKSLSGMGKYPGFGAADYGDLFKMYGTWMDHFKSWQDTVGNPMEDMMNKMSGGLGKDTFSNIFESSQVYMNLFEIWEQYQNLVKNGIEDPEAFKKIFNQAKYKDIIDKVFNFSSPDIFANFYDKAAKTAGKYSPMMEEYMKHFGESFQMGNKFFPGMFTGDQKAYQNLNDKFQDIYHQFMNPLVSMAFIGQDPNISNLLQDIIKKYTNYLEHYSRFQHIVYTTGQKATEELVNEAIDKAEKGESFASFDEFFKKWVTVNENIFTELFRSEEFTQLQADIDDSGLDIKKDFQEIMETMLKEYPVARRSEMTELHKIIHDLKKRVNSLEKELKTKSSTSTKARKGSKKGDKKKLNKK